MINSSPGLYSSLSSTTKIESAKPSEIKEKDMIVITNKIATFPPSTS